MSRAVAIRVLVAEDDAGVRSLLEELITVTPGLVLVGSAHDATTAIQMAADELPDVALVDVHTSNGGTHAVRMIGVVSPRTRAIAFSADGDPNRRAEMLAAGAVSYLAKGGSIDDIVDAIRSAAD